MYTVCIPFIFWTIVSGVSNFLRDIGRMLNRDDSNSKITVPITWKSRLIDIFGPTGTYIKWCWLLFSPLILGVG